MGGGTHDMKLLMNELALINPDSQFLLSCTNEGKKSMKDIHQSGKNLAKEVKEYLEDDYGSVSTFAKVGKITFIAFSLGGLILRAALPHLKAYWSKFHGFVTLSSPHLGYAAHDSKMIKSGLWVMEKFVEKGCVR